MKGLVIVLSVNFNNASSNSSFNNINFDDIFSSFKNNGNFANSDDSNSDDSRQNSNFDANNFNNFFNGFVNSFNNSDSSSNPFGNIDIGTIMKIKSIMDKMNSSKNDPRSNLLRSLKPYLKPSRKDQVDKYIQLFSMSQVFENMNFMGGEKKNDV